MDQINLTAWENRVERRQGGLSAQLANMARACFGQPEQSLTSGDPIPLMWHWFAFSPTTPTSELGPDGHAPLGDFLPSVGPARRMWAGGTLTFHAPLHVDEPLDRTSTIRKITRKEGASSSMVFVTVVHEISGQHGLAITEQQDIVYLPIPDRYTPPRKLSPLTDPMFVEEVDTSAPLLFRYSALTFNTHRIHYDLPYAQKVEHYPGLVVHGPLQASLLVDAATRHAQRPPTTFAFRGVHPVFSGEPTRLMGSWEGDQMALCTAVQNGEEAHQGMQATATWEEHL